LKKRDTWHFLTAGLGSSDMRAASVRVCDRASSSGFFGSVVAVTNENLREVCGRVSAAYPHIFNETTRGYGYMTYKPDAIKSAFEGLWGDCDGVVWIDAGCELFLTPLTRIRFNHYLKIAKKRGVACFSMDTPEIAYTKRFLFERFPSIDPNKSGNQIQATWLIAYGAKGRKVVDEWLDIILNSEKYFDLTESPGGEFPEFIEHRYDQSIFSLVCKKNGIKPMLLRPTPGRGSWKTLLRSFFHPIWTARNRAGFSTIPQVFKIFENGIK
jgi:hypothetical protein